MSLVTDLFSNRSLEEAKGLLAERSAELDDAAAHELKQEADRSLRSDVQRSLQAADLLLHLSDLTHSPQQRALGLLARANAQAIGLAEYMPALALYDEAAAIYRGAGLPIDEAKSQIGRLFVLACLDRNQEAVETGARAAEVLRANGQWLLLAKLTVNLGTVHARMGQDAEALSRYDQAADLYAGLGDEGIPYLARVGYGQSLALRNLGRFAEAVAAAERSLALLKGGDQRIDAARARQALAMTYFVVGRHNEALQFLDQVRAVFAADGRQRDALLASVFITDSLLELRQFDRVIEHCRLAREMFAEIGSHFEIGQTMLNEAIALAGLGRVADGLHSLAEARAIFVQEGNASWTALADLEQAALLLTSDQAAEAEEAAARALAEFRRLGTPHREAHALVVSARAAWAMAKKGEAVALAREALSIASRLNLPSVAFEARLVLGSAAREAGEVDEALTEYRLAIEQLELLRGRLMVEFRADFLEDKQRVYEEVVDILLEREDWAGGFAFAERAKSRSLLELLAYRPDLSVRPRRPEDQGLVEELQRLREERDRIYRRREQWGEEEDSVPGLAGDNRAKTQQEVLTIERKIGELWHTLLVQNADYANEASLWQVRTASVQPDLDEGVVLIEYFIVRGRLIAFLATGDRIEGVRLPVGLADVQELLGRWRLNLASVPFQEASGMSALVRNAEGVLGGLHDLLVMPLEERLTGFDRVIVVPHGPLHYLPFHAFRSRSGYWLERQEISYLPSAGLFGQRPKHAPEASGALALGLSWGDRLPHAPNEARLVIEIMGGRVLIGEAATRAELLEACPGKRVIHLASHGEFRSDQPLFSGLALADGWLTTLDVFGLRLVADLVTLSACQTGQSVIGGGDELIGLMRAFLYAGARSLVVSLWEVDDASTTGLMRRFYEGLTAGLGPASALRRAQLEQLRAGGRYAHPYFWAPFVVVGNPARI